MEKAEEVRNIRRQVTFSIDIDEQHICNYIADFVFEKAITHPNYDDIICNWREVIEDVKSEFTRKNPVYRLKKKLMKAVLNLEITEV